MIPSLSQEVMTQYASDAQTIQEPEGTDYSQGVRVGRTVPAKWWNWLFSAATKRIVQSRNDASNMLTELTNTVIDAGLTPSSSDNTQLTQAIVNKADVEIDNYVEAKKGFFTQWTNLSFASDIPSGYTSTYAIAIDETTMISVAFPYSSLSDAYTTSIDVAINKDGTGWSAFKTLSLPYRLCTTRTLRNYCCKFNGRYFLWVQGLTNADWQNEIYGYLFVCDDATEWTLVRTAHLQFSTGNFPTREYPAFGIGSKGVYLMTYEGTNGAYTSHLYGTSDAYNWTELASNFTFQCGPSFGRVIDYGNGFAWGHFLFDGTTVTPITSFAAPIPIRTSNPHIFSSGVVFYYFTTSKAYTAPSLGGTITPVTLSYSYGSFFFNADKTRLISIVGSNSGEQYATRVDILDDTLTATEMPQPPRSTTEMYKPFIKDGVIYCYRHKTTDLSTWEAISTLPEASSDLDYLFYCVPDGVMGFNRIGSATKYVSTDNLRTWKVTPYTYSGTVVFSGGGCWQQVRLSQGVTGGAVTFVGINRVMGHTLYLR